jgi:hypothetical protein
MASVVRPVLLGAFLLLAKAGWAAEWTTPTPEELSMTSQPEVPGASAVYLYRQEITHDLSQAAGDANPDSWREGFCNTVEPASPIINPQPELDPKVNYQTLYVRLKVLTPDGERYGTVAIDEPEPYWSAAKVEGRTIQPDGTMVAFSGKVDRRLISKTRDILRYVTSFQMPEVRVGSILEYRVTISYPEYLESPPRWFLQQELFVRSADYFYGPHTWVRKPEESNFGYTSSLPDGIKVVYNQSERSYKVHTANVMPLAAADYAPPLRSRAYRVIFHHTCFATVQEFWNTHGKWWSGDVDRFASASRLKSEAAGLVAAGDTEQQKVDKLYAAVAPLENLSYSLSDTLAARELRELKIGNAQEVWSRRQGSAQELTMLFAGLARAAGLKAYVMAVTDRSQDIFDPKNVREEDVDDYVAVVSVDGKEQFFDPGEPFCPAGQLSWKHAYTSGIRQSDGGVIFAQTPPGSYKQNQIVRAARVQVAKDGSLTGTVSLTMTGAPALDWRQRGLLDAPGFNDAIASELNASLPAGVSVKTGEISGLTDRAGAGAAAPSLTVQFQLTGALPVSSSGEIDAPANLFQARAPQLFSAAGRDAIVLFDYTSAQQDIVTLTPAAGMAAKSLPADSAAPLADSARLVVKHTAQGGGFTTTRTLIQGRLVYGTADYAELKSFYGKVKAADAEKVAIVAGP